MKKVTKLPGTFVRLAEVAREPKVWNEVAVDGDLVVARMSGKRWTILTSNGDRGPGILGCVGGYNYLARHVAPLLVTLRLWHKAQAAAFESWFREEVRRGELVTRITRARDVLIAEGWELKPPKKLW